jgi:hypothetical protein
MSPVEELESYAVLDGTEWGETMLLLCQLSSYSSYISKELSNALHREVTENLAYAKENCKVITETETYTKTSSRLEWYE